MRKNVLREFVYFVYFKILGTRKNPGLGNQHRMTFLALREYVTTFTDKYIKKGDVVLDFGCGNGPYKDIYKEKDIDYHGIDIGDSPEYNKNYTIYPGGKTPFKNDQFDVVVSTQVFEHLDNPIFYGQELERITKNGGYILLTIAHIWEYHPYPNHYFNIMKGAIPVMFPECEVIDVSGDSNEFQNISMFIMHYVDRIKILGKIFVVMINLFFMLLDFLGLQKIGVVPYNKMSGNILITLRRNK